MTKDWIPAPRFRGDKFTPAKAGAGMTNPAIKMAGLNGIEIASAYKTGLAMTSPVAGDGAKPFGFRIPGQRSAGTGKCGMTLSSFEF